MKLRETTHQGSKSPWPFHIYLWPTQYHPTIVGKVNTAVGFVLLLVVGGGGKTNEFLLFKDKLICLPMSVR